MIRFDPYKNKVTRKEKYMNTFITALENKFNYKFTENGAVAHRSTGSKVYDLFALGGAYRYRTPEDCILLFKNAYEEDPDLALKCLFYLRDCRGGQGERRFFRICYNWLANEQPAAARKNLSYVSNFGRWDDLFTLINTPVSEDVVDLIQNQLTLDMSDAIGHKAISLLGKWMPSENAHSRATKEKATWTRRKLNMTSKQYRQMLSKLREHLNVLERLMSANRWDEIEFDKIPSKAGLIYRNAFARRDMIAKKYEAFAQDKNTKVNAGTLYPYEIVEKAINKIHGYGWNNWDCKFVGTEVERAMINKYWENQKDYLNGESPSMLCVVDTSGSMRGRPINVAISLGLYCAERMTGPFAGQYISFASRPQLIETEGIDFVDKVHRIYQTNLCDNTNLPAVFDLLLNTVMTQGVKQEDIPKTIVVISDMEIDSATGHWRDGKNYAVTEMEKIREKWKFLGYELPKLVYWNVNARNDTILDSGPNVTFVSGCSPVIFQQVLTGKTGFDLMLETLLNDRYKVIKA